MAEDQDGYPTNRDLHQVKVWEFRFLPIFFAADVIPFPAVSFFLPFRDSVYPVSPYLIVPWYIPFRLFITMPIFEENCVFQVNPIAGTHPRRHSLRLRASMKPVSPDAPSENMTGTRLEAPWNPAWISPSIYRPWVEKVSFFPFHQSGFESLAR